MNEFDGRVVAVTGGSSGIGLATASLIVAEGGQVALLGRGRERLNDASDALGGTDSVLTFTGDAGDEGDMGAFADAIHERFGRLDGLAACVGAAKPFDLLSGSLAEWRAIVDANLTPALVAARAVAPALGEGGGVVLVGSLSPVRSGATASMPYAAAKAGIPALARGLAVRLAPRGVRVNCVTPGWIETPMSAGQAGAASRIPVGRLGEPHEVAEVIAFALSPRASFLTGTELVVDGGEMAAFGGPA
jgi:NAD(P)-dependent dehydrogenase (short-subunit alcohol dehydrogenase family)